MAAMLIKSKYMGKCDIVIGWYCSNTFRSYILAQLLYTYTKVFIVQQLIGVILKPKV